MTLLNLFKTGGLTLGVSAVFALITGIFLYQSFKASKSGSYTNDVLGVHESKENISFWKLDTTKLAYVAIVLWIVSLIAIAIDYYKA